MLKNNIINSVQTEKLQLDSFEKLKYFKVSILCFFVSLMSITNGFQQFSNIKFEEPLTKIGLVFFIIGLVSITLKANRLKMIILENPVLDFRSKMLKFAEERNWKIEKNDERAMIFITIPIKNYDNYLSYNKHEGERIYIFVVQNRVYLKSIDNLEHLGFKIHKGNNLANEKAVMAQIKVGY